ncbi:MAG: hypothetical protein ACWA5L_05405 [bacterium]
MENEIDQNNGEEDRHGPSELSHIGDRLKPDAPFSHSAPEEDEPEELRAIEPAKGSLWRADREAKRTKQWFRLAAFAFFITFLIGWPTGATLANYQLTGLWSIRFGFSIPLILLMLAVPILILVIGEVSSLIVKVSVTARDLEKSAEKLLKPEVEAAVGVRTIGKAVRTQIETLNSHLDDSLVKLANVESMIRKQIEAINDAGTEMEDGAGGVINSVASERENLIALTEQLNHEADSFAEAIAEKAKLNLESYSDTQTGLSDAEAELSERLSNLEQTAEKSLDAFDRLSMAIEDKEKSLTAQHEAIHDLSEKTIQQSEEVFQHLQSRTDEMSAAREKLAQESERLETLIEEQRARAEKLADAITEQTERLDTVIVSNRAAEIEVERHKQEEQVTADSAQNPTSPLGVHAIDVAEDDNKPELPVFASNDEPDTEYNTEKSDHASAPATINETSLSDTDDKPFSSVDSGNEHDLDKDRSIREQRHSRPWSSILAAAELPEDQLEASGSKQPATPEKEPQSETIRLVWQMQDFMRILDYHLYGEAETAAIERFENGERNIFAHILLGHDEDDLKYRIRNECERSPKFQAAIYEFLHNFDNLLEPATGQQDGENLIDDYLASPIGQVYVLTGAAVDYFV